MNLLKERENLQTAIEFRDYYYNQLVSADIHTDRWCKMKLIYELISDDINTIRKNQK